MLKSLPKRITCTLLVFLLALIPVNSASAALSDTILDMYNINGIYYYNPQGSGVTCYSGNMDGDTIMAKVVSYLKGNNPTGFVLSDIGIAGILANFQAESGFNPFRFQSDRYYESGGYGIAQFTPYSKILGPLRSDPRTSSYYNTYFDIKYTRYDSSTGFPKESVPMEVINAWLAVQLDFFFGGSSEFETTRVGTYRNSGGRMGLDYISSSMTAHQAMDAAKTPEDATRIFVWIMERPGDKEGDANRRSATAQKWLNYVQTMSASGGTPTNSATTSGTQVTVIGDSITARATEQINRKLPGVDIHIASDPSGIDTLHNLVDSKSLRNTLVFALGTNKNFTSDEIQEVVNLAGKSRKVIFVNNWSISDDYTSNNNTFAKIKNDNSNVKIADWKAAIEGKETTYLESDGVLPNAEGQELFAQIIANTIAISGSTLSTCAPMGLVEGGMDKSQAQRLADYYNSSEVSASYWGLPFGKRNCVSFSAFFVQRFTSIGRSPRAWGDGRNVAHNLAQTEGLPSGTEPRPYAVFSTTTGSTWCEGHTVKCGHTGIVVGVSGDKVITVEAAYGAHDAEVKERSLSYFVNTKYGDTFTYLDSILNQSDLTKF